MTVPFFDIHDVLDEDVRRRILRRWAGVLDHGRFVNGPEVRDLEAALERLLGVGHVVGCSNGSDALVLALRAAGVGPGDEVIVPALTFFASAGAVARVGATPVFADVDPASFLITPEFAAARATSRTRAVMVVHLYGRAAGVEEIRVATEAAAGRPVVAVEDAAQAIGAEHPGGTAGAMGITAAFSCFPTKNLGATGDAGFATTGDAELAGRMERLREHGGGRQYHHDEVGYNFRMDSVQAAALLELLPRLVELNAARRAGAEHYDRLLREHGLADRVIPPEVVPGHVFHQYVVRVRDRDRLRAALAEHGVGTAVYYPVPLHLQPCFAHLGGSVGDLPGAERAAEEVLALPIQPGVRAEQREEVVEAIAACLRASATG